MSVQEILDLYAKQNFSEILKRKIENPPSSIAGDYYYALGIAHDQIALKETSKKREILQNKAIYFLQKARKTKNKYVDATRMLATVYHHQKESGKGLRLLKNLEKRKFSNTHVYNDIGNMLLGLGRYPDALIEYQKSKKATINQDLRLIADINIARVYIH